MIDAAYVRDMARYNAWQNKQIMQIVGTMPEAELRHDHKAFFGSIRNTLNHLLWGDMLWMSRFDPSVLPPEGPPAQHIDITPTIGAWGAARFRLDGQIRFWSQSLRNLDLTGTVTWASGTPKTQHSQPLARCIVQLFNHQTHHRGQVHAMLTASGRDAPVSDFVLMPEEG